MIDVIGHGVTQELIDRFQVKSQYCNLGKSMLQYSLAFFQKEVYIRMLWIKQKAKFFKI